MAEIVGLISSITSVATVAEQLTGGFYTIATALKDNGGEVQNLAIRKSAFKDVLGHLKTVLRKNGMSIGFEARRITDDLLETCSFVLRGGEDLRRALEPLIEQTRLNSNRAVLIVRWLLAKPKFLNHQSLLESLKSTITFLVSVLTLEAATATKKDVTRQKRSVANGIEGEAARIKSLRNDLRRAETSETFSPRSPSHRPFLMLENGNSVKQITFKEAATQSERKFRREKDNEDFQSTLRCVERRLITDAEQESDDENVDNDTALSLAPYFQYLFVQQRLERHAKHTSGASDFKKRPTFLRVRKDFMEIETLQAFNLPWGHDPKYNDFYVIFKPSEEVSLEMSDEWFDHAERIRQRRANRTKQSPKTQTIDVGKSQRVPARPTKERSKSDEPGTKEDGGPKTMPGRPKGTRTASDEQKEGSTKGIREAFARNLLGIEKRVQEAK